MRGTVLYGPGDVRFEDREDPKIIEPTDAVIRMPATCVCGSDLWPYRGLQPIKRPDADGTRVLRLRRRGRQRGQVRQAGAIRGRLVRHVGQHLSSLPVRLPVLVRASRVHAAGAGAVSARTAGGRDAGADARTCPPTISCRACWRHRTCWARAGSPPMRRT